MRVSPFTSFSLDALRSFAALGIVVVHLGHTGIYQVHEIGPGHLYVICFFVLSGFVIAATSNPARVTAARYFALRLARLWTVALPCLAIALALEVIGRQFAPAHYAEFTRGPMLPRYALSSVFLNEVWFLSAGPMTNGPVWSLAYEAWYYAIFGIAVFTKSPPLRIALVLLACAIAGPKILLLMPIWLLGVLTWKLCERRSRIMPWRWWIFVISLIIVSTILFYRPDWPQKLGLRPLFHSGAWLSDFIFGCGVAGTILSVDLIWGDRKVPTLLDRPVREIASVSFTMYMLHYPLMVFAAGMLTYDHSNFAQACIVLVPIFIIIYAVGKLIEPTRKQFSPTLEKIFSGRNEKVLLPSPPVSTER